MKYNEKIKLVRTEVLRKSQAEFAELLGVKQGYVSNLESGRNDVRLSKKKETILVKTASLHPGFFYDTTEVGPTPSDDIFYTLVPEAKAANLTLGQVRDMLKVISTRKITD